jgi:uncharacterized membrane protein
MRRAGRVDTVSETGRVEAFSDGVFAIAITLLVLDLRVPARGVLEGHSLARALAEEWPSFAAYLVSFTVIGIIWVNHHAMFLLIRQVDRPTLFANLLLLLTISVLPFPTRLFAEYLTAGDDDARTAAAVYSATMVGMGLAFQGLWMSATRRPNLLHAPLDPAAVRRSQLRFGLGLVVYLGTVGTSFINAILTLAIHFAVAVYYCFNQLDDASGSAAQDSAD